MCNWKLIKRRRYYWRVRGANHAARSHASGSGSVEFNVAGAPGYSKQFFMFGPRDLYRPGETVILNGLLRDSDGKTLPDQPVKLEGG